MNIIFIQANYNSKLTFKMEIEHNTITKKNRQSFLILIFNALKLRGLKIFSCKCSCETFDISRNLQARLSILWMKTYQQDLYEVRIYFFFMCYNEKRTVDL